MSVTTLEEVFIRIADEEVRHMKSCVCGGKWRRKVFGLFFLYEGDGEGEISSFLITYIPCR